MRNVFLRYYNEQNLGDDLIFKIVTERYKNKFYIVSKKKYPLMQRKNVITFSNKPLIIISRICEKYLIKTNLLNNSLIGKTDLYVYVGGSLFIDNGDARYWHQEIKLFQTLKKPYYILGSNIGPYKEPHFIQIIKQIIENAADVCFRDKYSYKTFRYLSNVRLATDIGFCLNTDLYDIKEERTIIVSLINCSDRFGIDTSKLYLDKIKALTEDFAKLNYNIVLFSFCRNEGDEIAVNELYSCIDPKLINRFKRYYYRGNLDEALDIIAKCEIIIGTRFHAVILGLLFNKKVLPIAYSDKTINILNDMKFKGSVIDLRNIKLYDELSTSMIDYIYDDIETQQALSNKQFSKLDNELIRDTP